MDNESYPDVSFCQNNVSNIEVNYFLMTEVESSLTSFDQNAFSILHLNNRNIKNHFEILKSSSKM